MKMPSNNNEKEDNRLITFLEVFFSLLESCPSKKVVDARVYDAKSEMLKVAGEFNKHACQE